MIERRGSLRITLSKAAISRKKTLKIIFRRITIRRFWRENWLVVAVIAVMVSGYLFLRTPGDNLASLAEFEAQVTGGTPTLVEFYSNT